MRINIHEAKVGFSSYVKRAQEGERIIICNRNVPVAELGPFEEASNGVAPKKKRVLGFAAGEFTIPDSFYEPMTEEELADWEGPIFPDESVEG